MGVALAGVAALLLVLVVEALLAARGDREAFRNPSRAPRAFGSGAPPLAYVVLGDSTAAGQGAGPEDGIAVATARRLARSRRVTLTNLAVSGARTADVLAEQVGPAARLAPDLVLVSVGANDVTHLTPGGRVERDLLAVVDRLRSGRCGVRIVLTGAPDMGSIPRFAQPLRWVAGWRTGRVNGAVRSVVARRGLTFAPIAARTGPLFRRDPTLFSADRFHPNDRGYATWTPVLDRALAEALAGPAGGCRAPGP